MICHRCGKKTEAMGLCNECFMKVSPVGINDITIPACGCGRYYHHVGWHQYLEKGLEEIIRENVIASPEIRISAVEVEPTFVERRIKLKIALKGSCRGQDFREELSKDVRIEPRVCPVCGKIASSYYEAVLQFRVPVDARKVLDGEYVARTEKVAGGFDAYITSANYAKKLGNEYAKKGFIVKKTAKLVGKKEGKDLYRIYIAIKSPGPAEGDYIRYKGKILEVLSFGRSIRTRDMEQRKTLMIPPRHMREAKVLAGKEDVHTGMISSVNPRGVQIIDLETCSTIEVPGRYAGIKEKEEVRYVKIGDRTYIL